MRKWTEGLRPNQTIGSQGVLKQGLSLKSVVLQKNALNGPPFGVDKNTILILTCREIP